MTRPDPAMARTVLKSEIRGLTVTGTGPPGSLVLDADLLDAADLVEGERVELVGELSRAGAHVRPADRGSGRVELGGPGPGEVVSLLSYAVLDDARARSWRPRVLAAGTANRVAPEDLAVTPDPIAAGPVAETDDAAKLDALLQRPED